MKKIELQGKRVIDCLLNDKQGKRTKIVNLNIDPIYETKKNQFDLLHKLNYNIETKDDNELKLLKLYNQELKKKHYSYNQQDIKKEILNNELFISLKEIQEKLLESCLECYYCNNFVKIIYSDVRDPCQWTLDRINNDIGHNNDNVVICCLKCNLQRRRIDDEKFLFTKQLKIFKQE
jgi:hypothetical protein